MIEAIQQFFRRYKAPSIVTGILVPLTVSVWTQEDYVARLYNLLNIPKEKIPQITLTIIIALFGLIAWTISLYKSLRRQEQKHQIVLENMKPKHARCPRCLEPEFRLIGNQPHASDFFANSGAIQRIYKCSKCDYSETKG